MKKEINNYIKDFFKNHNINLEEEIIEDCSSKITDIVINSLPKWETNMWFSNPPFIGGKTLEEYTIYYGWSKISLLDLVDKLINIEDINE